MDLFGCLCLFCSAWHTARADINTEDVTVSPGENDNFYEADARCWIPLGVDIVKGVLVLLRGTDRDGRYMATQPEWQDFAQREHLALLGCYFRGDGDPYDEASGGSGQALLSMIEQAARVSGHPELNHVPLVLIGHSAGAMFSYNFARWMPKRVAGFVLVKTGPIEPAGDSRVTRVPALFIVGQLDSGRIPMAAKVYLWQRSMKGHWAFAVEPGADHGWTAQDSALARAYLNGVLVDGSVESNSWQCLDLRSPESKETKDNSSSAESVWLPDADSVAAWQRFTMGASVRKLASRPALDPHEDAASISPGSVDLGVVDTSSTGSAVGDYSCEVTMTGSGGIYWSFISTDPRLQVNAEKLAINRYRIAIELRAAGMGTGYYRGVIRVIPAGNAAEVQECALPVDAQIQSSIFAIPSSLYLGVLSRGQIVERTIRISSRNGNRPPESLGITSSKPQFASAQVSNAHGSITCRFDGTNALGNQSGYFDVTTGPTGDMARIAFIAFVLKTHSNDGSVQ
jgi:pimeloyl-ACP methyl ester carboxylesterase